MIKIEKGVPLSKDVKQRGRFPFADMVVGDSFFVPDKTPVQMNSSIQSYRYRINKAARFACARANGGTRVWRIK